MIQIEEVSTLPELSWLPTSEGEFSTYTPELREALVRRSSPIMLIREDDEPLLVAGIYKTTFLSQPWLWVLFTPWLLLAKPSTFKSLRRLVKTYAAGAHTFVETPHEGAERCAAFFGFQPTSASTSFGEKSYTIYRRAWWGF
jgi:hypothetical protein